MRVRVATMVAGSVLAALLVNHVWVGFESARITRGAAGNLGVDQPSSLRFFVKLDHFAEDYGYILIPFFWTVAFILTSIGLSLANFLGRWKTKKTPEHWPIDP